MSDHAARRSGGAALQAVLVAFVVLTAGWLVVGALAAVTEVLDGLPRTAPAG
ncbi:hypothetical protein BJ970_005994 [Saccharopolyspora phatthalungensis]|uniref:Uncharacterized protein n=1 Tax=Saccharopolyspora phatthalungensis TaxID=664693 RepID=A0A840QIG7_9PSEU|nr:hypothetical protein [Saccharopolyspora phatthalungensis]